MKANQKKYGALVVATALAVGLYGVSKVVPQNPNSDAKETKSNYTTPKTKPKPGFNTVVKVIDGDTIEVDIDGRIEKVRMIGVDTPETVDPRKTVQCFGKEASNKTKEMLTGKDVRLEFDPTQDDRDKYDRLLRYIFLEDGTNFNLWLITNGYAHEYTYQIPYKFQSDFKVAERKAQDGNKGLWSPSTCNDSPNK